MWTKLMGNIPVRSGSFSTIPSIQLSSSVCSLMTMMISPSWKESSSSLSAAQSYRALHLLNVELPFDVYDSLPLGMDLGEHKELVDMGLDDTLLGDVGKIWDRLFDHRGFLGGEIQLTLEEFEKKRNDAEVDHLFGIIEVLTEIKDTEIPRCKEVAEVAERVNDELLEALKICDNFRRLEGTLKQDSTLENFRNQRKTAWNAFMETITSKYSEINSHYETKEEELKKYYEDIEKKFLI
nr:unnamed protein product [Callosobruchus analis]